MAFEVISVGGFAALFGLGLAFFAASWGMARLLTGDEPGDSMIPNVARGIVVGLLAIFGTVSVGMAMGFGCADPDYYEDQVETPEEAGFEAQLIDETPADDVDPVASKSD